MHQRCTKQGADNARCSNRSIRAAFTITVFVTVCSMIGTTVVRADPPLRWSSQEQVVSGRAVYLEYCQVCHGTRAQGQPRWKHLDANGLLPPPPLDGTGHAWHHPLAVLREEILTGSVGDPFGNMPPWEGVLSETQIVAAIAYFQSLWPPDVYRFWWREMQRGQLSFTE